MPELQIIVGDALTELQKLPTASVQTCITSPPYYGLRDYGTGIWEGGKADCQHRVGGQVQDNKAPGAITTGQRPGVDASRCKDCGARRVDQQLGLEPTPDAYVAKLVEVFREVKRVLRDDGTLWLNMGDSYCGNPRGNTDAAIESSNLAGGGGYQHAMTRGGQQKARIAGMKHKDLLGIPWMVAFALRADGWYLRSEIIWAKPNPMPESVTDRPTKAHETVFLLSKSRSYYYDADAIREPGEEWPGRAGTFSRNGAVADHVLPNQSAAEHRERDDRVPAGRNKRSVWTIATQPYPEAHFATFPPKLVEPMVLAGSPFGGMVLDPFAGSGTTLEVAISLGRSAIGIELSEGYADLAGRRLAGVTPAMFAPV